MTTSVLQNGLNEYLNKIRATRAFYDASVEVDPNEFALFTGQILAGYGDTMRLVWCPYVTREERDAFETKARRRGLTGYSIRDWAVSGPNVRFARSRRISSDPVFDRLAREDGDVRHRPEF